MTNAIAGGTVDALTVPLLPCGLATNLLLLTIQGTNAASGPTLQMAGFPALPVVNANGAPLGAGALPAGGVILLSGTGSRWLMLSGGVTTGITSTLVSVTTLVNQASYQMLPTDQIVEVQDTPAAPITITLPDRSNWPNCPASLTSCPELGIKDALGTFSSGEATVTTADGTLIDGVSSFPMFGPKQEQDFVLTSLGWSLK